MDPELESLTDYAEDGVDLTLIRATLAMTPGERLDFHESFVNETLDIWKHNGVQPVALALDCE